MPILVFRGKGISDGVKTKRNQLEKLILEGNQPEDLESTSRNQPGEHEAGGRAYPPGRALHPRGSTDLLLPPIYIHIPRKHPGAPRKPNSTAATFCTREIPSWGLFRHSAGGEIDHGGLLRQQHSLSDDV